MKTVISLLIILVAISSSSDGFRYIDTDGELIFFEALEDRSSVMAFVERGVYHGGDVLKLIYLYPNNKMVADIMPITGIVEEVRLCKSHIQAVGYDGGRFWRYIWTFPGNHETFLPTVCKGGQ